MAQEQVISTVERAIQSWVANFNIEEDTAHFPPFENASLIGAARELTHIPDDEGVICILNHPAWHDYLVFGERSFFWHLTYLPDKELSTETTVGSIPYDELPKVFFLRKGFRIYSPRHGFACSTQRFNFTGFAGISLLESLKTQVHKCFPNVDISTNDTIPTAQLMEMFDRTLDKSTSKAVAEEELEGAQKLEDEFEDLKSDVVARMDKRFNTINWENVFHLKQTLEAADALALPFREGATKLASLYATMYARLEASVERNAALDAHRAQCQMELDAIKAKDQEIESVQQKVQDKENSVRKTEKEEKEALEVLEKANADLQAATETLTAKEEEITQLIHAIEDAKRCIQLSEEELTEVECARSEYEIRRVELQESATVVQEKVSLLEGELKVAKEEQTKWKAKEVKVNVVRKNLDQMNRLRSKMKEFEELQDMMESLISLSFELMRELDGGGGDSSESPLGDANKAGTKFVERIEAWLSSYAAQLSTKLHEQEQEIATRLDALEGARSELRKQMEKDEELSTFLASLEEQATTLRTQISARQTEIYTCQNELQEAQQIKEVAQMEQITFRARVEEADTVAERASQSVDHATRSRGMLKVALSQLESTQEAAKKDLEASLRQWDGEAEASVERAQVASSVGVLKQQIEESNKLFRRDADLKTIILASMNQLTTELAELRAALTAPPCPEEPSNGAHILESKTVELGTRAA